MTRKRLDIHDFIKENFSLLTETSNSFDLRDWSKKLNLTVSQARYRLDKLVELDLATRYVHQTAHDRINYGFNLNVKTAMYCVWPHKLKAL